LRHTTTTTTDDDRPTTTTDRRRGRRTQAGSVERLTAVVRADDEQD